MNLPRSNNRGFTLVELLISMVVASILMLTIGVLSTISVGTFQRLHREQALYNDVAYGIKLMQHRVRGTLGLIQKRTGAGPTWINGEKLIVGNQAFGIYSADGVRRDLVYLSDQNDENDREVLLSVPGNNLNWTVTCNPDCSDPSLITSIDVSLSGIKDAVSFNMQTTIFKRNS